MKIKDYMAVASWNIDHMHKDASWHANNIVVAGTTNFNDGDITKQNFYKPIDCYNVAAEKGRRAAKGIVLSIHNNDVWELSIIHSHISPGCYSMLHQLYDGCVIHGQSLTHLDRVTYIWVGNLTILDSDNGLSHDRRQAIIWKNIGVLFIGPLGTNVSDFVIGILTFSFQKIDLKVSPGNGDHCVSASMC